MVAPDELPNVVEADPKIPTILEVAPEVIGLVVLPNFFYIEFPSCTRLATPITLIKFFGCLNFTLK